MEQGSDQRAPQGGGQEASEASQAASQKAPGNQADQDGRAGKDQYRVESHRGGQHQPDGRNLSPEAAMASARSGVSSDRTVGGHAMGDGQAASHPGQDCVGGKRGEATLPQGIVGQRDGEVDQHGDGPGSSPADRTDEPPHPDRAHR